MWPPTGSLSLPGKKLCWHRKTRHPPAATAVPSAQKVRAPSLANDTGEMCHGVGDSSSVAPARGQRAGLSWATQVKRSAWAGPSDWGKIPLEGNRGEFPHDLHTAGAGPPAPRGGEGAGGQQPSRSGDRKFEAGIPLLLLPQLRKPLRVIIESRKQKVRDQNYRPNELFLLRCSTVFDLTRCCPSLSRAQDL